MYASSSRRARSLSRNISGSHIEEETLEIDPMLWTIFVILIILWLLGFTLHIGGSLIHILLVVALICLVYNLLTGRRAL
jgi:hypothetical protein